MRLEAARYNEEWGNVSWHFTCGRKNCVVVRPFYFLSCDFFQAHFNSHFPRDSVTNRNYQSMMGACKPSNIAHHPRCKDIGDSQAPCLCQYEICVGWYPCGLKYCKGHDPSGKLVNYRCGIKTCRKCRVFDFLAKQKSLCLWDE